MDLSVERDGGVPIGTQLAWKLRSAIETGELRAGEQLPSVREAAAAAAVNVNTVRAVYGRLERDGLVSSEQGRGTFVSRAATTGAAPPRGDGETQARRALRRQIAILEAELSRRPPPPTEAEPAHRRAPAGGTLLNAAELRAVRDGLLQRLDELDAARAEVLRKLEALPATEALEGAEPQRPSRASVSLVGARVRWVGA